MKRFPPAIPLILAPCFMFHISAFAQEPGSQMSSAKAEADRTVVFKITDELPAGVDGGVFLSSSSELTQVVAHLEHVPVQRFFEQGFSELDQLRTSAMEMGAWPVPQDLNLFFRILTDSPVEAQTLISELSQFPGVQVCYLQPGPSLPPVDIPPNTSDWTGNQGYFQDPGPGTNQWAVAGVLGARGRNIRVTDCEYDWVLDHEDIELDSSHLVGGTPIGIWEDHGTAVAGELYAQDNGYGMTGGVPHADLYFSTEYATSFGFNPTQSILNATVDSGNGDVILLEMQTPGPTSAYVPEEWTPASFAAVEAATALGIHVVEAGGNGGMDLDSGVFGGYFDTAIQDSRAVIVGAGTANANHTKLWFTSRGSRVDCQAWGESVYTTGYGSLWQYGTDDRQDYTSSFSGTSSASPIVTSAVAATLGTMKAHGMTLPTPLELRDALRNTGTPQLASDVGSGRIGPMPDLEALFDWFGVPSGLRHQPRAGLGDKLIVEMDGSAGASWELYRALGTSVSSIPAGTIVLEKRTTALVATGTLNRSGLGSYVASIPNDPALQGLEVYTQVLFSRRSNPTLSNGGMVTLY